MQEEAGRLQDTDSSRLCLSRLEFGRKFFFRDTSEKIREIEISSAILRLSRGSNGIDVEG